MMEQDRFKADDVLELMGRCEIELPDEFDEVAPAVRSCRLTAKLKNGDTVVVEERRSLDDDVADPGWDHAVEKFRGLTADLFSADAAGTLIAAVDALDRAPSLTQLIAATKIG
jgi:2-methylcitrate dehydratase PrpD